MDPQICPVPKLPVPGAKLYKYSVCVNGLAYMQLSISLSLWYNFSYHTVIGQVAVTEEERERLLADLQEKAASLERRLEANYSQDEHLQELLKEVRGHVFVHAFHLTAVSVI